jgi:hypothetical protein
MKTVLAPGAPWPKKPAEKPEPKKRVPRPPKVRSKIQHTDKMFQLWADKNLGGKTMSWEPKYTKVYSDGALIEHTVQRTENGPIESLLGGDGYRNEVLEEVAVEFDKMKVFGDTAASFALFVRGMKK